MNGFVFDELPLEVVRHACNHAKQHGAAVFFDPGTKIKTLTHAHNTAAHQAAHSPVCTLFQPCRQTRLNASALCCVTRQKLTFVCLSVCVCGIGPRCFTMLEGQRRQALEEVMALSEVVLMTEVRRTHTHTHTDTHTHTHTRQPTLWCTPMS